MMFLSEAQRNWLRRIVPGGAFARSVTVLVGGTVLGQALGLLLSPILTRLYTPADFGILAVYISLLSIAGAFAALSYESAVPLPKDDATAANVLMLAIVIVLGMSILVGLGLFLWGEWITRLLGAEVLQPYLWLLPLSLVAIGIYTIFNEWAVRKGTFGVIAQTKLSQSVGRVLTQICSGFLHLGPFGLLLGDVIGRTSGVGTLMSRAWRQDRGLLKQISIQNMRWAAYRYRRFPIFSTPATVFNNLGMRLPTLLVASLYGPQVVGLLELGEQIVTMPLGLISGSMSQVYVSEAAKAVHDSPGRQFRILFKVIGGMLLISLPYVVIISLIAPILFPIVFGSEWAEAGLYVQILAVAYLLQSIAVPTGGTLLVLERQDLHLARETLRVVLFFGVIILIGYLKCDKVTTIVLFGVTRALVYLFYLLISFYAIWRTKK